MNPLLILLLAVLLDYRIGDPKQLPHPIVLIGKFIKLTERLLRKVHMDGYVGGGLLWLTVNGTVFAVITVMTMVLKSIHPYLNDVFVIYGAFSAMAATCLAVEVRKVKDALYQPDLTEPRTALSYLVGRDTQSLSKEEIIKGAIETTAENTIDGVLAPLFYLGIGFIIDMPLQMVFLYKTVNTLDSMVGYVIEPYTEFGYISAKIDDLMNFIPARIGSFVMLLAGGVIGEDIGRGLRIHRRDRNNHKSPNAGHPEAAVAGLLGIQLGGTHTYFGQVLEKPIIGDTTKEVCVDDIETTIRIMYMSEFVFLMIELSLLALLWSV